MKQQLLLLSVLFLFSCNAHKNEDTGNKQLNALAEKYVRLGLSIGQYDTDFVDAYYGPDSLKPVTSRQNTFPKR